MANVILFGEPMALLTADAPGKLEDICHFSRSMSGAEVNVAIGLTRLGHHAQYLTRLGDDPFGDKIADEFRACGISCDYVKRTKEANTSLAFVALKSDGNREFSFYRKPGADMLMKPEDMEESWFEGAYALHFC